MAYVIEKGIPLPTKAKTVCPYPWEEMEVGDSFLVPGAKRVTMASACRYAGKKRGRRYIARPMADGIRCWRTA